MLHRLRVLVNNENQLASHFSSDRGLRPAGDASAIVAVANFVFHRARVPAHLVLNRSLPSIVNRGGSSVNPFYRRANSLRRPLFVLHRSCLRPILHAASPRGSPWNTSRPFQSFRQPTAAPSKQNKEAVIIRRTGQRAPASFERWRFIFHNSSHPMKTGAPPLAHLFVHRLPFSSNSVGHSDLGGCADVSFHKVFPAKSFCPQVGLHIFAPTSSLPAVSLTDSESETSHPIAVAFIFVLRSFRVLALGRACFVCFFRFSRSSIER